MLLTTLGPRASDGDRSATVQSIGQAARAMISPGLGAEPLRVGRTVDVREFLEATALEDFDVRACLAGN